MREITKQQLEALRAFFGDLQINNEWLLLHIDIDFDDITKTVTIKIDDMNDQEYDWLKS